MDWKKGRELVGVIYYPPREQLYIRLLSKDLDINSQPDGLLLITLSRLTRIELGCGVQLTRHGIVATAVLKKKKIPNAK